MNPKDKALELVEKFHSQDFENYFGVVEAIKEAIQCALICVDEIIDTVAFTSKQRYWQSVKQELLNLK